MEVLAVIPARAGSKGVNNKNILPIAGKPAICYTIDEVRKSQLVGRIVVTTESPDIKRVASDYGVEVIDRPAEFATDTSRLDYCLRHALEVLEETDNYVPDVVAFLMANVPLREPGIIDRCIQHLVDTGATSVRTFSSTGKYHPQWMSRIEGDRVIDYEPLVVYRRQDLVPLYIHDGACIVMTREAIAEGAKDLEDNFGFMGNDARGIISADGSTVEIDSLRDVYAAEAALRWRSDNAALEDND